MKCNLKELKFHSFHYDKQYHNLYKKDGQNYLKSLFGHELKEIIKKIKDVSFNDFSNTFLRSHGLDEDKAKQFMKIIQNQHPNLYMELMQILDTFNYKNPKQIYKQRFGQIKIKNEHRLIVMIFKDVIYPLILDLNHCFYNDQIRGYENDDYQQYKFQGDFKKEQETIKKRIR